MFNLQTFTNRIHWKSFNCPSFTDWFCAFVLMLKFPAFHLVKNSDVMPKQKDLV